MGQRGHVLMHCFPVELKILGATWSLLQHDREEEAKYDVELLTLTLLELGRGAGDTLFLSYLLPT